MTEAVPAGKTEVVVVDDSAVQRRFVRSAVEADPDFSVVGEARNGKEAVALVARLKPAAVLMDLELPVMGGIEAIERIMAASPTPILVYSAHVGGDKSANALEALAAGAVDVLAKPDVQDTRSLEEHAEQLRKRLRVASRIRVITHPRGRLRNPARAVPVLPAPRPEQRTAAVSAPSQPGPFEAREGVRLVAIGASTGGPQALQTMLAGLPGDLDQAVLVVQHMAEGFIPGLVSWLDQLVALPVVVGAGGQRLAPGTITVAPSGGNLVVQDPRLRVACVPPDAGQFHIPGIDQCFTSIADHVGPEAVGVILTGMGRDGAAGLKQMRARGAVTLGQDEASSTVYGMPQAAFALDAVDRQLPIADMAEALLQLVGRS